MNQRCNLAFQVFHGVADIEVILAQGWQELETALHNYAEQLPEAGVALIVRMK